MALLQLGKQGFKAHLPLFVAKREQVAAHSEFPSTFARLVNGKLVEDRDVIRPLFPSYLFVRFDLSRDRWRAIPSTIGVQSLFMAAGHRPIPVPAGVVEALIERGRPGDGVIDDTYQGPSMAPLSPEERVKITSGPFAGLHGICSWSTSKRVGLLLEAMGAEVQVDRASVVASAQ
jgi:transcription antitermination factor NusG